MNIRKQIAGSCAISYAKELGSAQDRSDLEQAL
jgi:hypothetical protein